ncbi:FAD-dependent oxidoreductase [Paenibacillus xylaniclasticus]|uniref:FAD-dependent oxidoreductase n=1 Tax=Paenibacillus xylaniclasticus TaxID=588083 RepID=UPI001768E500|nr:MULTISPECIES: NAD(P)/FAD-dependent oxidoreductase [Paenibacillus]GFN34107.1 FAD-dependent oxidoreductase [Paenibacillus curdlanolyticus]
MNHHYDVIIVGARVAGATLAYELSQAGYEVLLVDKGEFPSDTLSTHNFFNNSVAILRQMGVLDRLLATGTPLYRRAVVQLEDAVIDGEFPAVHQETECLCIRRIYLDQALFEHAAAQSRVTAIEGFRVTDVIREGNTITGIAGVHRSGAVERFIAKLVVGADGRNSTIRSRVNSMRLRTVPTDYASYVGYFSGYEQDGAIHVEMYKIKDKLVIAFPTSDHLYVIGAMFPLDDQEWSSRFAQSSEVAMRELIDISFTDSPLPERLRKSALVGRIRGMRGYDNDWYQGMGEGWALVGDALSFKDPAVGQGMHDALQGARILTGILSGHERWDTHWGEMAHKYASMTEAAMLPRYHMACQITKNVPFTPEQMAVNRLIATHPEATKAFLGVYNHALEPEQLEQIIGRLLQGG